jgi:hypothetical protein
MKNTFIKILLLTLPINMFGQIKSSNLQLIGEIKNGVGHDVKLSKSDTHYILNYCGINTCKDVKFTATDDELKSLKDMMLLTITEKKNQILELGDSQITFTYEKFWGYDYVKIGNDNLFTRPLNKEQIQKLFGN